MTQRQGTEELGTIVREGDAAVVRFTRWLPASPERVWRALVEPAELAGWLDEADVEPRVGGAIEVRFDDGTMRGHFTDFDPPRVVAYSWHEDQAEPSHVRFTLEPEGDGTRLTLEHTKLALESASGFGAGWHLHLDRLEARVAGTGVAWSWERFGELKSRYEDSS